MTLILKDASGGEMTFAQFRMRYRNEGFSGEIPPPSLLEKYGLTVGSKEPAASETISRFATLSSYQFAMALTLHQIITPVEAEAWAVEGTLPSSAVTAINKSNFSETEKLGIRIRARKPDSINRVSPIIDLLKVEWELTDAQVDALFVTGAGIPE